jgi:hypothetical protein
MPRRQAAREFLLNTLYVAIKVKSCVTFQERRPLRAAPAGEPSRGNPLLALTVGAA